MINLLSLAMAYVSTAKSAKCQRWISAGSAIIRPTHALKSCYASGGKKSFYKSEKNSVSINNVRTNIRV